MPAINYTQNELILVDEIARLIVRVEALENQKPRKAPVSKPDWEVGMFDELRETYPRTTARPPALRAWNKLKPDDALIRRMIAHFLKAYEDTDKEFIPHFSSYLNGHLWENEIIDKSEQMPKDINELQSWYVDRGGNICRPGESEWDYRNRVESAMKQES